MTSKVALVSLQTGAETGYEFSGLCKQVKWAGRTGSPTRTATIDLLDDDGYGHERLDLPIEEGQSIAFGWENTPLHEGICLKKTQKHDKSMQIKVYDQGIYLSNNKDTFVYEGVTASYVFTDVCTRFGIPMGDVAETEFVIEDLTKSKTTGWDAIQDALQLEYENTGKRYYVIAWQGYLCLRRRLENTVQWVLETGASISGYTYTTSMEDIKTRIKLISSEGETIAQKTDEELEGKIGIFQDVDVPDETLTTAQIKELAATMLAEQSQPERTLKLTDVLGQVDCIAGAAVYVIIPHLDISKTFYIESDTHTFLDQKHTMTLTLRECIEDLDND